MCDCYGHLFGLPTTLIISVNYLVTNRSALGGLVWLLGLCMCVCMCMICMIHGLSVRRDKPWYGRYTLDAGGPPFWATISIISVKHPAACTSAFVC